MTRQGGKPGGARQPRLPAGPLLEAFPNWTWNRILDEGGIPTTGRTARFQHEGVPLWMADRLAIGLGVHPAEVWDEWVPLALEAAKQAERRAA